MPIALRDYFDHVRNVLVSAEVSDLNGKELDYATAVATCITTARSAHGGGNKLIFVGNGGSAAIASHMAMDYSTCGNLRSLALNDGAMLTCISNDLGYENVFAKQVEMHAYGDDVLFAISSSGCSENILNACATARQRDCRIITLSGFRADNPLRKRGDINFYLSSDQYGVVEIGHLTICHAILDFACGINIPSSSEASAVLTSVAPICFTPPLTATQSGHGN